MLNKLNIISIRNFFFYAFFALLFLYPFFEPHVLILSLLLSFFIKDLKIKIGLLELLLMLFFMMYLLSGFYSENTKHWSSSVELKVSFLLFPIFFPAALKAKGVDMKHITVSLIIGMIGFFIICLIRAVSNYVAEPSLNHFFSSGLTYYLHPTYISVAINFIIYLLLKYQINPFLKGLSLFISIIFIVLASSKIGLILLFLNIVFINYRYFVRRKKIMVFSIIIGSILFVSFFSYKYIPVINSKFNYAIEETFYKNYNDKEIELSSTGQRIVAWKASTQLIADNFWLGVGSGDIKDELEKEYIKLDYKHMKLKLDSHQQFLQTFASTGVFGFLVLLLIFGLIFIRSYKKSSFLLFIFGINMLLFGLTESMLETQAGVFTFLIFLYVFNLVDEEA